jgi:4-hydroxy-3-methylbut-2-enyl diphosphate reductase
MTPEAQKPLLSVVLCSPRGFCAGVVRAIDTVERALKLYGAPVYVRHEIVHNRYVVESLREKGAIFVAELNEIPETDAPVVFSAHGVPKAIPAEADKRNFFTLDATCPLVTKVHREAAIHGPRKEDICYATTNRQLAVKKVAPQVEAMIVVGSPNSSNSQRLREVAEREGCKVSVLVQRASELDWSKFEGIKTLGITAGASAPEVIVEEIMDAFAAHYHLKVETVSAAMENEFFPLPRPLRNDAAE